MRSILKKILAVITHVQVLAVFFAFALMVFFSYRFMSAIERKHLLHDVNSAISNTQAYIEADLMEPETTLGVIAENVRAMILHGVDFKEVREYLTDTTKYITTDERLMSYATRVYGVFDKFGGEFWPGMEWTPPDGYIPQERPWYKAAIEANGKVAVTEPYHNVMQNDVCITFARRIFDNDGQPLGVVCLDVLLDRIREYVVNTFITEDSYGILVDRQFNVIAHPHPAYLGKHLSQMNDGQAIQEVLMAGKDITERKATDYNGNESVLFIRHLKNGWYMAILAYADKYYKSVTDIAVVLTILGAILASVFSAILLSIFTAKKKAEERTQIMLDATPLCANFWDKQFKNIDCSQEAVKMFEMPNKKEYLNRFDELSPEYQPDGKLSREKTLELLKKAFEEGYCRFEWMHRKLNGEQIPCEITLIRVRYRNDYMIAGYTRDLREMKSIMTKMREANECSKVLFDATPLSCFMIDSKNRIIECNEETARLFGLPDKKEFIEKSFDFFPKYQPTGELSMERIIRYVDEAFEEGYCRFEWIHQKLSGEQLPTEVTLVRVKYMGEYAVACYIRDLREIKAMIAEMRRAEIAEESNKAKSDFLAKMSHEIRTPMNAILGITEIQLQDDTLPAVTKEALGRIYNSGDLLLGIINDILDLSKIEAGRLELIPAQYDVASLIHDIVMLNIMRYESKPIKFNLDVNETVPSVLIGDELRIKQILSNLLSNAFKYTNEGMISLSVYIEPENRKEGSDVILVFCVSDTGQGMTEEQIRRLGDKFTRFNVEANRATEGTGLGMNITRNLIYMMDGDIAIDSTPGMGSTFTVRLPQGDAGFDAFGKEWAENLEQLNLSKTAKTRNAQITREFMPYGRVLVVDDVETNIYVARGLLAPYGLSIDTALSGFEAIEKIREGGVYDIVFMDHMMPKMDGIEAVKIIRGMGYAYPIIALTANALAGQAEMFLNNGFDGFISKPIDIRQLNTLLNKMIRDKQPQDVLEAARQQKNKLYASVRQQSSIDQQLADFFVRDAEKAAGILETICANKCRRADDISMLIINTHAMKSALANVGENELSENALKLEQAGRDRNVEFILTETPKFLEALRTVIEKNKSKADEESGETVDENAEDVRTFLRERLLVIQAACSRYDKRIAKETLAELKQKSWPQLTKERLNIMAVHLLHSEFEEASMIAQEIMPS